MNAAAGSEARQGMQPAAGLILAGGQSRRMGRDKASLRFGPETLLALGVRRMREVVRPIAVSLAPGQALDPSVSGEDLLIVRDEQAYGGPLPGLLLGFRALAAQERPPGAVLVMPVDLPFFAADWMRRALDGLRDRRACLYRFEGFVNALVGAYDLALLPKLERLAAQPKARPLDLSAGEAVRILDVETLWRPEEGPAPLMDTDTPEDYGLALALAGMGHPDGVPVTVILPGIGSMHGEQPLLARKIGDVVAALRRLFPGALAGDAPPLGKPRLVRVAGGSSSTAEPQIAVEAEEVTPLQRGEVLRWVVKER